MMRIFNIIFKGSIRRKNNTKKIIINSEMRNDIEDLYAENAYLKSCLERPAKSNLTYDEILHKLVENEDKISHLRTEFNY